MNLKILNAKEIKNLKNAISIQWDCDVSFENFALIQTTRERIHLISRDIEKISLKNLKLDTIGMYFCEFEKDGIRLSMEGARLVGVLAKKNIIDLSKEEMRHWLKGQDIQKETQSKGYVILKHEKDYLGCGKMKGTDTIINFVPKTRRILAND